MTPRWLHVSHYLELSTSNYQSNFSTQSAPNKQTHYQPKGIYCKLAHSSVKKASVSSSMGGIEIKIAVHLLNLPFVTAVGISQLLPLEALRLVPSFLVCNKHENPLPRAPKRTRVQAQSERKTKDRKEAPQPLVWLDLFVAQSGHAGAGQAATTSASFKCCSSSSLSPPACETTTTSGFL